MTVDIGFLCYWLALSGIGQVTFSHSDKFPPIEITGGRIEQRGGGGGMVVGRTLMFSEHTVQADLWWEPPFAPRHDTGGSYPERRWHIKTLFKIEGNGSPRAGDGGRHAETPGE